MTLLFIQQIQVTIPGIRQGNDGADIFKTELGVEIVVLEGGGEFLVGDGVFREIAKGDLIVVVGVVAQEKGNTVQHLVDIIGINDEIEIIRHFLTADDRDDTLIFSIFGDKKRGNTEQ